MPNGIEEKRWFCTPVNGGGFYCLDLVMAGREFPVPPPNAEVFTRLTDCWKRIEEVNNGGNEKWQQVL